MYLLNKEKLVARARVKEFIYGWRWVKVGKIKVLFPNDFRASIPTIFFSLDFSSDKSKVPDYIIYEEPCNMVDEGSHI